ncbi:DUF3325 family protein [Altererythrobacter indicus]|uniref:DUF3325 family protein n=1 Tax=Altericroceibacterium indicum TaxID=374177 RepID=A0A845ABZ5_9SPHN|nr:DUF3325 domain-containing protein [Altericroceibacterium indicum]MXP27027.1 DUF3325 family protein [Altericroceibacterium indicum]
MIALAFILLVAAFLAMGLADKQHGAKRLPRRPTPETARRMQRTGRVLIAASFPPAIAAEGWIFGPVLWSGLLMAGAGAAFLALNFLPDRVKLSGSR